MITRDEAKKLADEKIFGILVQARVTLTLENGDPVSFQRNWIAYITKR